MDRAQIDQTLAEHAEWLHGRGGKRADLQGANLRGASLEGAYLRGANLDGANLQGAYLRGASLQDASLWGATGNMREIRSAHIDAWPIAWATAPDGTVWLQIGCQRHTLSQWERFSRAQIAPMDAKAPAWWAANKDWTIAMVRRFPATPWGEG